MLRRDEKGVQENKFVQLFTPQFSHSPTVGPWGPMSNVYAHHSALHLSPLLSAITECRAAAKTNPTGAARSYHGSCIEAYVSGLRRTPTAHFHLSHRRRDRPAHPERRKLRRRPCAKTDRDGGHDGRGRDLGMDTTEAGRDRVDVARGV